MLSDGEDLDDTEDEEDEVVDTRGRIVYIIPLIYLSRQKKFSAFGL